MTDILEYLDLAKMRSWRDDNGRELVSITQSRAHEAAYEVRDLREIVDLVEDIISRPLSKGQIYYAIPIGELDELKTLIQKRDGVSSGKK